MKVESPRGGDPYRGLATSGLHKVHGGVDLQFLAANRGKKSVAIDLGHPDGRRLLGELIAGADVFATNLRPAARRKLGLDPEQVRADNPGAVYVRGSAFGPRGPQAGRGGYDAGAYWARSGMQHLFTAPGAPWAAGTRAAFGDVVAGMAVAGAVAAAMYRRASTGETSVIDVSLLAAGMWQVQADVVNAAVDAVPPPAPGRYEASNPLMLAYRTSDGRYINLQMLSPDRHWPGLCALLGRPEVAADPRFADIDARRVHAGECIEWLEAVFATRTYAEWEAALDRFPGEWAACVHPAELRRDPQVAANGYLQDVDLDGFTAPVVPPPVQFDGAAGPAARAPELGEHTEEVLLGMGLEWPAIASLKERGVIL